MTFLLLCVLANIDPANAVSIHPEIVISVAIEMEQRPAAAGDAPSTQGTAMSDDDYIYDEATGEWRPASEIAAAKAAQNVVRDASGTVLADGDSVVLIKDLKVKGAGQTLKQGTVIKTIRLTDNPEEIDCRHDAIKGLVLRTEFVRKR
jgi:protein PhnA